MMRSNLSRLAGAAGLAFAIAACTNDYDGYEFNGTDGGAGKAGTGGGGTSAGGTNAGGTSAGGTSAGGTSAGGTSAGGTSAGGTGGAPTGGTGGVATGGTGGTTGCPGATKSCGGQCVGQNDPQFGCGPTACTACSLANAQPQCSNGQCAVGNCTGGFGDCDQNDANGCEQALNVIQHCGACERACSTQHSTSANCTQGTCRHACDAGWGDCSQPATGPDNGCESNLDTTKNHCGSCANNCGQQGAQNGFGCVQGKCGCTENSQCITAGGLAPSSCNQGSGLCVCDGTTCGVGETCGKQSGNTVCECNGQDACGGSDTCCPNVGCKDLTQDDAHCGGCNNACPTGKQCNNGQCV